MSEPFKCYKCKELVQWRKLPSGKVCPENLDGSDHWDICREKRLQHDPAFRAKIATLDKEREKPITTYSKYDKLYEGTIPPWDESLGEFRPN